MNGYGFHAEGIYEWEEGLQTLASYCTQFDLK